MRHLHHVTGAPMRPASVGHCTKNLLEIKRCHLGCGAKELCAGIEKRCDSSDQRTRFGAGRQGYMRRLSMPDSDMPNLGRGQPS